MREPPHVEPLLVIASSSTPENEGPQRKDLESVGTSRSSLSNLTPVLPPTAKRMYALALLRLLWYGGRARHPRGCGATRSRCRDRPRAQRSLSWAIGSVVSLL